MTRSILLLQLYTLFRKKDSYAQYRISKFSILNFCLQDCSKKVLYFFVNLTFFLALKIFLCNISSLSTKAFTARDTTFLEPEVKSSLHLQYIKIKVSCKRRHQDQRRTGSRRVHIQSQKSTTTRM